MYVSKTFNIAHDSYVRGFLIIKICYSPTVAAVPKERKKT